MFNSCGEAIIRPIDKCFCEHLVNNPITNIKAFPVNKSFATNVNKTTPEVLLPENCLEPHLHPLYIYMYV